MLLESEWREEDCRENRWVEVLSWAMWSLRTTPSTVTKMSPYFQVNGIQPQPPSDFLLGSYVEENTQQEETHIPTRMAATQISTLKAVQKRHDQNQKQYARKVKVKYYKPGTLVWRPYDVKGADRSQKFTCYWSGPYKVSEHNYDRPHQVRIGPAEGEDQWQRPVHMAQPTSCLNGKFLADGTPPWWIVGAQ
jgi:hypothetical protein